MKPFPMNFRAGRAWPPRPAGGGRGRSEVQSHCRLLGTEENNGLGMISVLPTRTKFPTHGGLAGFSSGLHTTDMPRPPALHQPRAVAAVGAGVGQPETRKRREHIRGCIV